MISQISVSVLEEALNHSRVGAVARDPVRSSLVGLRHCRREFRHQARLYKSQPLREVAQHLLRAALIHHQDQPGHSAGQLSKFLRFQRKRRTTRRTSLRQHSKSQSLRLQCCKSMGVCSQKSRRLQRHRPRDSHWLPYTITFLIDQHPPLHQRCHLFSMQPPQTVLEARKAPHMSSLMAGSIAAWIALVEEDLRASTELWPTTSRSLP